MRAPPVVFVLRGHRRFVAAGAEAGAAETRRFANRELIARVSGPIAGRPCVLVGSIAPPESQLARVTLLVHALARAGAARITALLPYLAYARQDVAGPGESLGIAWIGGLLGTAGVDEVVTVDVHSDRACAALGLPVRSLSPAALLADALPEEWRTGSTFVAPDEGAVGRCAAVAAAVERPRAVAHLVKRRDAAGIAHRALHGDVGERALVVDDILDTGATVASCCRMLRDRGVRRIALAVTHGLFTGAAWPALRRAGVEAVWVTDSVVPRRAPSAAHLVPLAPLLAPVTAAEG